MDYSWNKHCWIVTITNDTSPSLADLAGLILALGSQVEIDIKPGSDPNSINLGSKGLVPVAILTTKDFDASDVDPSTVWFAGAKAQRCTLEDVDEDGDLDLLCFFKTQDLNLGAHDESATLTATASVNNQDQDFVSTDAVRVVPPAKEKKHE
jgi:hypothetical protein